jgi:four helix bundle protein
LGSAFELETQLLIADAVSYGQKDLRELILNDIDTEQKMLIGYLKTLSSGS